MTLESPTAVRKGETFFFVVQCYVFASIFYMESIEFSLEYIRAALQQFGVLKFESNENMYNLLNYPWLKTGPDK